MVSKDTKRYYEVKFIIRPLVALFKPMTMLACEHGHHQRTVFVTRLQLAGGHTYYIDTDDEFTEEQCQLLLKDIYKHGFKKEQYEIVDSREDAEVVIDIHDEYSLEYSLEYEFNEEWVSLEYDKLPHPPRNAVV